MFVPIERLGHRPCTSSPTMPLTRSLPRVAADSQPIDAFTPEPDE